MKTTMHNNVVVCVCVCGGRGGGAISIISLQGRPAGKEGVTPTDCSRIKL